jgi:hypothetical protein
MIAAYRLGFRIDSFRQKNGRREASIVGFPESSAARTNIRQGPSPFEGPQFPTLKTCHTQASRNRGDPLRGL